jgi:hypothetical protein
MSATILMAASAMNSMQRSGRSSMGGSSEDDDSEKIGCIVFIVLLALIVGPAFIGWELPKQHYTIEMTLITGEVVTKTYNLPNDAIFSISSSNGTYVLGYSTNSKGAYFNLISSGGVVKHGVIDYKIKNHSKNNK